MFDVDQGAHTMLRIVFKNFKCPIFPSWPSWPYSENSSKRYSWFETKNETSQSGISRNNEFSSQHGKGLSSEASLKNVLMC